MEHSAVDANKAATAMEPPVTTSTEHVLVENVSLAGGENSVMRVSDPFMWVYNSNVCNCRYRGYYTMFYFISTLCPECNNFMHELQRVQIKLFHEGHKVDMK